MWPVHWKMLGKINTSIKYFNKKLNNKSISFNDEMQRKTEFFACFVVSELKKFTGKLIHLSLRRYNEKPPR